MKNNEDVVIVSGCRTPIGSFGGSLRNMTASQIAEVVVEGVMQNTQLDKAEVDEVILGNCNQQCYELNIGRVVALSTGFPAETTGLTVQRNCSSGMQAVISGMQSIILGDAEVVIAGGVEAMSAVPFVLRTMRWGQRMMHSEVTDALWTSLKDPNKDLMMGETAENLAEYYNINREEQDEVALRSHQNALSAIENGRLEEEIVPVTIPQRKGSPVVFEHDECPRKDTTLEKLSKLPTVFRKGGTVTAGNSSAISDGAAAVLITSRKKAKELSLSPMGKVVSYAWAGVKPEIMGMGPVPATEKVMKKAGLSLKDIGIIELNEAFAAQYITCERLLGLDRNIVNVNGGAIAIGHPVGVTGARLVVTLLHEMRKRSVRYGLATLCVGGGMGMSMILENLQL